MFVWGVCMMYCTDEARDRASITTLTRLNVPKHTPLRAAAVAAQPSANAALQPARCSSRRVVGSAVTVWHCIARGARGARGAAWRPGGPKGIAGAALGLQPGSESSRGKARDNHTAGSGKI